jgi:hypothetical protein
VVVEEGGVVNLMKRGYNEGQTGTEYKRLLVNYT